MAEALDAYRAETAPLRTRAERDRELFDLLDDAGNVCPQEGDSVLLLHVDKHRLMRLLREDTAPEAEPDADLRDPEPCGCEESVALRERLKSIADWVLDAEGAVKNIRRLAEKP